MTDLTETQRTILAAAAIRPGMRILPLPDRIKGGAVTKVLTALTASGLVEETAARPGEPTLRDGVTLVLTAAAFAALGVVQPADDEPSEERRPDTNSAGEHAGGAPTNADEAQVEPTPKRRGRPKSTAPTAPDAAAPRKTRDGTKQALLITMLRRSEGATIAEIAEATGWQHHTIRGALAGALKKKLGLEVTSEKVDARGRVYRLPPA